MANARSSQGSNAGREDAPADQTSEPEAPMVADESETAPEPVVNEPTKYPRSEHIELALGMYDEPAHVVAGALSLLDPTETTEAFTKAEVEAGIKRFYNHKITEAD